MMMMTDISTKHLSEVEFKRWKVTISELVGGDQI